jgi:N-acetylneuraminate synthase/sialic acid synthase
MIRTAKVAGASAVKFQTRFPPDVYSVKEYSRTSDNPQWMDRQYGKHRELLEFTPDEWRDVFEAGKQERITVFSTPFDHKSADLLIKLGAPMFKIASGDATNLPLIQHVAGTGKPVLVSTGGCTQEDVDRVVTNVAWQRDQLALLQCTCIYPAKPSDLNLRVIETYRERYPETVIGLSTHCPSWKPSLAAYVMGARIFEHHYTNDRQWKGTDNPFSLDTRDMTEFIDACKQVQQAMGTSTKACGPREAAPTLERRKKLIWRTSLPMGERVRREHLVAKCPGDGIEPYHMEGVIGQLTTADVVAESDVTWASVGLRSR